MVPSMYPAIHRRLNAAVARAARKHLAETERNPFFAELNRFDESHGLSAKAHSLAELKGHQVRSGFLAYTFARRLVDYVPAYEGLSRHLGSLKGKKVLHVGASTGIFARFLESKGAHAVALDLDADATAISKKIGVRTVRADALELPFRANSFDCFVSDHFLFSGYLELESIRP
ncbi:MAG: methyltransferase domain-containing protein, partial [Candidatus Diapherotrites archaeon]|nr:methyltransferase domain-containing protein [Candidatus Diapherotrites archaeon]